MTSAAARAQVHAATTPPSLMYGAVPCLLKLLALASLRRLVPAPSPAPGYRSPP